MSRVVKLVQPILIAFINSKQVKELVCDLIDRYAKSTDNDIDDVLAKTVRAALIK
jgi:hypothetical protein